ncbi:hypothetical protein T492DRAFT_834147 [Pavlovales sp. CCMP2436]|nr:hypothetical protein T492DRAFT_834147 [Pavlovales sp. CCMP2436]|eukprot:CAMPEP_0180050026 /NCGR_PEP_ID=MMETSP0985-20121206/359_1 /TAXON_ID=483367 /ORGANISM="non described non described, Strain CCMP 2436" /LENGTH=123 /DNA_ID=CAMNT_0021979095 /DNA_START=41 /DNA_END=412 /DNA_ORIENTATION=-
MTPTTGDLLLVLAAPVALLPRPRRSGRSNADDERRWACAACGRKSAANPASGGRKPLPRTRLGASSTSTSPLHLAEPACTSPAPAEPAGTSPMYPAQSETEGLRPGPAAKLALPARGVARPLP